MTSPRAWMYISVASSHHRSPFFQVIPNATMVYVAFVVFQCENNQRIVTFFVSTSPVQMTGTLVKLIGTKGMYGVDEVGMDDPPSQPGYIILMVFGEADTTRVSLVSTICNVEVDNENDEWDDRDWAQDVLRKLESEGVLSVGGADRAWQTVLPFL